MKQTDIIRRYPLQSRAWALVDALNNGWTPKQTAHDPDCIAWMLTRLELYTAAKHGVHITRPTLERPVIPAPSTVSIDYEQANLSFWRTLADVGALRGLHLVSDGRGGYTATIKITLQDGRQVYRYGRLQSPDGIEQMLEHTVRNDRWTPDKI